MDRDFVERPFVMNDGYTKINVYQYRDQVEIHFENASGETTGGAAFTLEEAIRLAGSVLEAAFAGEKWIEEHPEEDTA